jgi:hypothetical protein
MACATEVFEIGRLDDIEDDDADNSFATKPLDQVEETVELEANQTPSWAQGRDMPDGLEEADVASPEDTAGWLMFGTRLSQRMEYKSTWSLEPVHRVTCGLSGDMSGCD